MPMKKQQKLIICVEGEIFITCINKILSSKPIEKARLTFISRREHQVKNIFKTITITVIITHECDIIISTMTVRLLFKFIYLLLLRFFFG